MISTRQLIFIINIVFFFVNPTTSGNRNSSTRKTNCFRFLFGEQASTSNVAEPSSSINNDKPVYDYKQIINVEEDIILYEVTSVHIEYCKMELFNAFKLENGWDNFLHGFSNITKADFDKEWSGYTEAAAEYYFDLLCVAHEMRFQPRFMNPRAFCQAYFGHEENYCLRSIKKMECEADVPGVVCLRHLYFNWKDEELPFPIPLSSVKNISDEDLENAVSRITAMFPDLSVYDLRSRLSEANVLEAFYRQNKVRRERIYRLHRDRSSNIEANRAYNRQREEDVADACESCYGIRVTYIKLIDEYERRKQLYRVHVNPYAAILLNQLQECGQMNQDFIENNFKNREQFCTSYLSENRHYYDFMYLFTE